MDRTARSSASTTQTVPRLELTPDRNSFSDQITPLPTPNTESFAAYPFTTRPSLTARSSYSVQSRPSHYFHSRRVRKGEVEQPWRSKKDPKEKWVTILPLLGLLAGCAIAGFLVYDGISSVVQHKYCPVLDDDFSAGINTNVWTQEAEVGGFG